LSSSNASGAATRTATRAARTIISQTAGARSQEHRFGPRMVVHIAIAARSNTVRDGNGCLRFTGMMGGR
jgi:hypothetical protein